MPGQSVLPLTGQDLLSGGGEVKAGFRVEPEPPVEGSRACDQNSGDSPAGPLPIVAG